MYRKLCNDSIMSSFLFELYLLTVLAINDLYIYFHYLSVLIYYVEQKDYSLSSLPL